MNDASAWPILAVLLPAFAASVIVAMLVLVWRLRRGTSSATSPAHSGHADTCTGTGAEDRRVADRLQVVAARLSQVRQRLADAAQARATLTELGQPSSNDGRHADAEVDVDEALAQARAALDDQTDALQQLALWYGLRGAGPWPTEAQCLQLATTPLSDLSWRVRHHLAEAETRLAAVRQLHHGVSSTQPTGPLHRRIRLRLLHNLQNWEVDERTRCAGWRALARDPDARETSDLAELAARPPTPVDNTVLTALVSDIAALHDLTAHPWMRGAASTSHATSAWQDSLLATRDELQSRVEAFLEMDELLGDSLPPDDSAQVGPSSAADGRGIEAQVEEAVVFSRSSVLLVVCLAMALGISACAPDDGSSPVVDAAAEAGDGTDTAASDSTTLDTPADDALPDGVLPDSDEVDDLSWFVQTVCTAQAAHDCRAWTACGCPTELLSPDGCETSAIARCAARAGEALAGRTPPVRVDRSSAATCAAALAALPIDCGEPTQRLPVSACATALTVARDVGERCQLQDAPCGAGDARCRAGQCVQMPARGEACLPSDAGDAGCAIHDICLEGRCAQPPEVGGRCDHPDHCPQRSRCVDGRCVAVAVEGERCDPSAPCAPGWGCVEGRCLAGEAARCTTPGPSPVCGNEALCGAPVSLLCTALGDPETPCTADDQCQAGLVCAAGRCGVGPQEGEACLDGVTCGAGFACDFAGERCLPVPQQGELCAPGPQGPHECATGLGCVAGRCAPMPQSGEPCTTDARCGAGLGCHFADAGSRCDAPNPIGGPCQNDSMCAANSFCDFSRAICAAHYAEGELCVLGNECGPTGACLPEPGGGFRCGPLPDVGESCFLACQPGAWCEPRRGDFTCYPARCQRAP